ncbi:hypothetical protein Lal_00032137 [Lupinus albus]|nr:hypothetical protein Lal_00032137 [Lupinus albus]
METSQTKKPFNTLKSQTKKPFNNLTTMSSQTPENEQGTMANTQTQITQTPETQTQKRKQRGVTAMKSVVRARSNNNKLTVEWNAKGQPLNNKGGNTLASYIGVVVRQNISIKFKQWSDDRLTAANDIIWKDITKICEQNRASNPIYPYRLEQCETPSPSSAIVDLDVLWVNARKNKQGVINNEKVQEVVNRVVSAYHFFKPC